MNFFKNLEHSFRRLNHRRIQLFRVWRTQVLLFVFNQKNINRQHVARPKSALFLRLDGKLGDTITFSALIQQMIQNCPDLNIHILTRKNSLEVYQCLFPELIKNGQIQLHFVEKNLIKIFKTIYELKPFIFDVMVSTSHILDPQSIILARLIQARNKISFLNQEMIFFDHHIVQDFFTIHITERYKKVIESMGLTWTTPVSYSFSIPAEHIYKVSVELEKIKSQKKARNLIVLNSFAGARLRNLNYETTLAMIKSINTLLPNTLVISIANAGDLQVLKSWRKKAEENDDRQFIQNWFLTEQTSLLESSAVIALSDLVITPDTSIVHLASALNKPLIALFRPDEGAEKNSKIWSPLGENYKMFFSEKNELLGINAVDVGLIAQTAKKIISLT